MEIQLENSKYPLHFYFIREKILKKQIHFEIEAMIWVHPDPVADGDNEPWNIFSIRISSELAKMINKRVMDAGEFYAWYYFLIRDGWLVAPKS